MKHIIYGLPNTCLGVIIIKSMTKKTIKGATVWLIRWDSAKSNNEISSTIAAILNHRLSGMSVKKITELLYVNKYYSLTERLSYAKNKQKFNSYPASFDDINGVPWNGRIVCGNDPFLVAEIVDDFVVIKNESGLDTATWRTRKKPNSARIKK